MQTHACMTPSTLKIWECGSIIKEIIQTMRMELLTAKLLNLMFFVYCWRARFQRKKRARQQYTKNIKFNNGGVT